uniref:Uncharacterized protein n=1 Tax=Panagrolaimus superbus TaxID=310955 RepID=A0A914Y804_9BILA
MIPLTASPPTHHHDATTPYFVNATEKLPEELTKKWTTFETICYAYMWVLSCALAFVIGICAGQAKPKTRQVRTIEVASTSV